MRPAEQLKGLRLSGGWTVLDLATRAPQATGGKFSTGYVVQHDDGRRGFLKAMDYIEALQHPDTLLVMQALTQAYRDHFLIGSCSTSGAAGVSPL